MLQTLSPIPRWRCGWHWWRRRGRRSETGPRFSLDHSPRLSRGCWHLLWQRLLVLVHQAAQQGNEPARAFRHVLRGVSLGSRCIGLSRSLGSPMGDDYREGTILNRGDSGARANTSTCICARVELSDYFFRLLLAEDVISYSRLLPQNGEPLTGDEYECESSPVSRLSNLL